MSVRTASTVARKESARSWRKDWDEEAPRKKHPALPRSTPTSILPQDDWGRKFETHRQGCPSDCCIVLPPCLGGGLGWGVEAVLNVCENRLYLLCRLTR